jgi:hypothetical protein
MQKEQISTAQKSLYACKQHHNVEVRLQTASMTQMTGATCLLTAAAAAAELSPQQSAADCRQ